MRQRLLALAICLASALALVTPQAIQASAPLPEGVWSDTTSLDAQAVRGTPDADSTATTASVLETAPAWTGQRRLAVILVNFRNDQRRPFTRAFADQVVFTNPDSVRAYYAEQSHGAVELSGKTFDWVTIRATNRTCQPEQWAAQAKARLMAEGADLGRYTNLMFMFPSTRACPWRGFSNLPGPLSWVNGTPNLRTPAHELAHNFGVHHASTLRCTSTGIPVALSSHCTRDEYGDPFSIMGASQHDHVDNLALVQMGYLPADSARTVTESGTYTLTQPSAAQGVRVIGIPRGDGTSFYLEYRRPSGQFFDDFAPDNPAVNGVTIRLAGSWTTITETQLIDTHPATATFADAPLRVGGSFHDYLSGTSITVVQLDRSTATIKIVLGPGAPPTAASPAEATWTNACDTRQPGPGPCPG